VSRGGDSIVVDVHLRAPLGFKRWGSDSHLKLRSHVRAWGSGVLGRVGGEACACRQGRVVRAAKLAGGYPCNGM